MSTPERHRLGPQFALIVVTAVWGSTFFLIKELLHTLSPLDFLAVRFTLAALFTTAMFWRRLCGASALAWKRGLGLGCVYGIAQILQTWGLASTAASVSGFITGMYVVLTPLVLWALFRTHIRASMWAAVLLASAGLAVLSLRGWAFGFGECLTLAGAGMYALHIVLLGRWAKDIDTFALTGMQMLSIAAICMIGAAPGGIALPQSAAVWLSMLYMALAAGLLALVLQTWAQARIPATKAAIIMTTEPVFAAVFAVTFSTEQATWRLVVGGALILVAMLLAELTQHRKRTTTV